MSIAIWLRNLTIVTRVPRVSTEWAHILKVISIDVLLNSSFSSQICHNIHNRAVFGVNIPLNHLVTRTLQAFPLELKPPEKRKGALSNGVGPAAKRGRSRPDKPRVELSDMLGRLEKLDELNPPDKEEEEVEKKRGDSDDDDEDNEAKSPSAALEEDEAEDMDDYVQDYAGDDFDALGSESGGDDY